MKKNNYNTDNSKISKDAKNHRTKSLSTIKNIRFNKPENKPQNEVPIIDLLKCPICKKICLMNINREKLLFSFECNNTHTQKITKCNTSQKGELNISIISDLNISHSNFNNLFKDNNTSIISGTYNSKKNSSTPKIYITEKDFYCQKHPSEKYHSFCYECKENICKQCLKEHSNHNKIELNTIKPKEIEVTLYKNDVKKKDEELNIIIDNMMKWQKEFEYGLSIIIKILQNISNLRQFVIMNYDPKQSNQNYNYIQNFNNMKVLNFMFPELLEFLKEPDWKQKGHILIEIMINIQNKIIKNKENLEVIKLQKETQKLKENLEKQEKILKSKNKNFTVEENEDVESVATTQSNQVKNFATTYNSDFNNNIYFNSEYSREVAKNRNTTKRKIIEKRNRNRNRKNDAQTHTIEQNKELENDKRKEEKYDENNHKINLEPKIIRVVESSYKNTINADTIGNNNILDSKDEFINKNNINYNVDDNNHKFEDEKNNEIQFNDIQNITDNNAKTINDQNEKNGINQYTENSSHGLKGENNIDENTFNKNNYEIINNNTNNFDDLSNDKINNINKSNDNKMNHIVEKEIKNTELKNDEDNIKVLKHGKNTRKKNIYQNIDLKYELINTDIIRSIEFINTDHILICTLENISVYKMNSNYELIKEYDIKDFNYRINYATQLLNGNLIICSLKYINIIKLSEGESLPYTLVQKLNGKDDSYNINKVIEIKGGNNLISCDKNNLIIYAKNDETNLYEEKNFINIDSEVKCLEAISEKIFVTLEPERECVIFYDIETLNNISQISNIKSSFGRYVISYLKQYNCIFVTGRQGIYLISTEKYELITFFKECD